MRGGPGPHEAWTENSSAASVVDVDRMTGNSDVRVHLMSFFILEENSTNFPVLKSLGEPPQIHSGPNKPSWKRGPTGPSQVCCPLGLCRPRDVIIAK